MFAAIYLPNFYLQAAVRHHGDLRDQPIALIDDQETKAVIIEVNQSAAAAGVTHGMTSSQGLARCMNLVVKTRARSQETVVERIVHEFAYTLTPYIEATAPGVCTVRFTNNKDLSRKVTLVIEQLRGCELIAQAGIAHTADASLLAAHLANPVLEINDAKEFFASLPIEALAR